MRIEMHELEDCYINIIADADVLYSHKYKKPVTLLKNVMIENGSLLSDHCRLKSKKDFYGKVKLRAKVQKYYKKKWDKSGLFMDYCLSDILFISYL